MSKSKQTYRLGKIKQLIDLNGQITNFDLNFSAVSNDSSEFYAVVVDQTTLDNNPTPDYKKVKGKISGNIVADKGVYQNYFLLLKANNPCDCEVTVDIREIPKNTDLEKRLAQNEQISRQTQRTQAIESFNQERSNENSRKKGMLFVIALLLIFGILLYFYFKSKSGDPSVIKKSVDFISETGSVNPSPSPSPSMFRTSSKFKRTDVLNRFR